MKKIVLLISMVMFVLALTACKSEAKEVRPGEDNDQLVGAWVGRITDDRTYKVNHYYEFCSDGTGYKTYVGYDSDTEEYFYSDSTIDKIQTWSFSDGYGFEFTWLKDRKTILVQFSTAGGCTFTFLDDRNFLLELNSEEYHFEKLDESLLTDEQKRLSKSPDRSIKKESAAPSQSKPEPDLSAYDDHGEWSSDRMWVHKTESSWDRSEGYYGYIDRDGKLVGRWHSDQEWIIPQDFVLDYAVVYVGDAENGMGDDSNYDQPANYEIIDLDGNTVYRFGTYIFNNSSGKPNRSVLHNFNENGLLFYREQYIRPAGLYTCTYENVGIHIILENCEDILIHDSPNYKMSIRYFDDKFMNGYITHNAWDYMYIDRKGNIVLDLTEFEYSIVKLLPIKDGAARVVFRGKDGEDYVISMDFDGNWLTEPKRYRQR